MSSTMHVTIHTKLQKCTFWATKYYSMPLASKLISFTNTQKSYNNCIFDWMQKLVDSLISRMCNGYKWWNFMVHTTSYKMICIEIMMMIKVDVVTSEFTRVRREKNALKIVSTLFNQHIVSVSHKIPPINCKWMDAINYYETVIINFIMW